MLSVMSVKYMSLSIQGQNKFEVALTTQVSPACVVFMAEAIRGVKEHCTHV